MFARFEVANEARYCAYRPIPGIDPPLDRAEKPVQVWSGVGVSPVRTPIPMLVPAGVVCVQEIVPQETLCPASKTRESKVPEGIYGLIRIQSITARPPPTLRSLARAPIVVAPNEMVWVATAPPSTKYATVEPFQSMR